MSRSKLIRALLAAASLLGALPLMAQTQARANEAFPYGSYTSTLPADDNHSTSRTLQVELREGAMRVFEDGQLIQAWVTNVSGRHWKVSRLGGPCPAEGDYTWAVRADTLSFTLVSDSCPGRGEKMVRTRLVRALPAAAPAFPYGRYSLQAMDSTHAPPPGLVVEFTSNTLKVMNGDQLMETHGSLVVGEKWQVFEFDGGCQEPGDYRWHLEGTMLWMEVVNDPCTERAQNITSVHFLKQ